MLHFGNYSLFKSRIFNRKTSFSDRIYVSFYKKIFFIITCLSTLAGCEIYDEGFDLSSTDVDKCAQAGGNCAEPTGANLLALNIATPNPTTIVSSNTEYCGSTGICNFDISGMCNEADFPENIIEFRVFDPGDNSDYISLTRSYNKCIRGKYRLRISLPAGCVLTAKRISIEVLGRDLNGTEHRNPLAAKREVDILYVYTPTSPPPVTPPVTPTCPPIPLN